MNLSSTTSTTPHPHPQHPLASFLRDERSSPPPTCFSFRYQTPNSFGGLHRFIATNVQAPHQPALAGFRYQTPNSFGGIRRRIHSVVSDAEFIRRYQTPNSFGGIRRRIHSAAHATHATHATAPSPPGPEFSTQHSSIQKSETRSRQGHNHPNAEITVEVDGHVPAAHRTTSVPGNIIPGTAPHHGEWFLPGIQ